MATTSRRKSTPLSAQLLSEPHRFDFFQAVRLMERIARERSRSDAGYRRQPVGGDQPPHQEIVRFRALPSHTFPPGAINSIRPAIDDGSDRVDSPPLEMVVAFMGMTGPSGVLPQHYTQLVINRARYKDYSLRDFLDLFNHRSISLFYRAWEKYRFPFAYERTALDQDEQKEDLFTHALYCLVGMGTERLRNRLEVDDEIYLFYAGHFAHFPRTATSLESIVCDFFELPAEVIQFYGQWLCLSEEDQTQMPTDEYPRGRNNQLGVTALIGERVWGVENKFRLRLGPLNYDQFCRFTPIAKRLETLCQVVRTYVGPEFDFDIQPILRANQVPWCRLGGDGSDPSYLGWNTWVHSLPFESDVDDAVFAMEGWPS